MPPQQSESPDPMDKKDSEPQEITEEKTDERFAQAMGIVEAMSPNGMKDVRELYPDLTQTRIIDADDPRNLMGKMSEPWLYSAKHDVTVIVCRDMDTPVHVFKGKNIPQTEIDEVKQNIAAMMEDTPETDKIADAPMQDSAQYVDYEAETFSSHNGKKILFFYADWCPTCRNWDKEVNESLAELPQNTYIAKVDYDSETNLKKEYGITVQSTAVFLDENGNVIATEADPSLLTITEFFNG